jgi:FkbM family methyltransferase
LEKYHSDGITGLFREGIIHPIFGVWVQISGNQVEYRGMTIDLDNKQVPLPTKGTFLSRAHERAEFELIDTKLREDTNVIELGAGIGVLSCYINRILDDASTQIAVEANPELIPTLKRNRCLNDSDFIVHAGAYSPNESEVEFPILKSYKYGSMMRESGETRSVAASSITSIASQYNIDNFGLVVDIEGTELELISHEIDFIAGSSDWVMVEFHPSLYDRSRLRSAMDELRTAGFSLSAQADEVYLFER